MKSTLGRAMALMFVVGLVSQSASGGGGETCASATQIQSLPFVDTGTTCGANDNYDESCPDASGSPDVVYRLTAPSTQCINVAMCNGTEFDAKLYVYSSAAGNCPPNGTGETNLDIACADEGCPGAGSVIPRLGNLQVESGVSYWFVVDGSGNACGNYRFAISVCASACVDDSDCCDGDFCNGREYCGSDGVCQPGSLSCDDDNPCTVDSCNAALESCVHTPVAGCCVADEHCDDGNPCTNDQCERPDACSPGTCTSTPRAAGLPCGDRRQSPCDQPDTCDGDGLCQSNKLSDGSACNDGRFCTLDTTCLEGVCDAGLTRDCDDGNPRTLNRCDEETRSCEFIVNENCCFLDAQCDDENECTADHCIQGSCGYDPLPPGTPCGSDASSTCSNADSCQQGVCRPNHAADGTVCNDNDDCTMADRCLAGSCTGVPDPDCAAGPAAGGLNPLARRLSFQAFLADDFGVPINEPTDLTFQLYDDQGTPMGSPIDLDGVMVKRGVLTTQIPVPFGAINGGASELGVQVNGGDELTPRVPLTAAPFALTVDTVGSTELSEHLDLGGGSSGGALRVFGPEGSVTRGTFQGASVVVGTESETDLNGQIRVCGTTTLADGTGDDTVMLNACEPGSSPSVGGGGGGQIRLADSAGNVTIELDGSNNDDAAAELVMYHVNGSETVELLASETGADGGQLRLRNSQDNATAILDAESSSNGAHLYLRDDAGNFRMVEIVATEDGNDGAQIVLRQADGKEGVQIDAESSTGAKIRLYQNDYDPNSNSLSDDIGILLDGNYDGGGGSTGYGRIRVRNEQGESTVTIDGDFEDSGKGRVRTDILRIDGGSDFSESFDIRGTDIRPGYLVSIDPLNPGKLEVSARAYDPRLAGVISGAGGIDPGLIMGQTGSIADGEHPVAMSGRVYCWADASRGAIEPGDLLTTSDVPGHAMRAGDPDRLHGAVIGKAMSSLHEGRGLVLVLIRPQ